MPKVDTKKLNIHANEFIYEGRQNSFSLVANWYNNILRFQNQKTRETIFSFDKDGFLYLDKNTKFANLFIMGTGLNNNSPPQIIFLNENILTSYSRGLNLIILNSSLKKISQNTYDTYGSSAASNSLASNINSLRSNEIGILVSYDAWEGQVSDSLREAARKVGLSKLGAYNSDGARRPYAAIFQGTKDIINTQTRQAIERMESSDGDAPRATINTTLSTNGNDISIGSAFSTNALYSSDSNIQGPSLIVDSLGNVGIGKTSPTAKLEIEGGSANWNETTPGLGVGTIHLDPGVGTDNYGNAITFGASDSSSGNTAQAGIYIRSDGSYGTKMYFATTNQYTAGSKTRLFINYNGNVGIGTTSPTTTLHVNGTVTCTTIIGNLTNAITFNNGGAGAASGTTFNNSAARTISYNTIGAPSTTGTGASGTWGISITGNAASAGTTTGTSTLRGPTSGFLFTPSDDTDTGLYDSGTNTLGFYTANAERMRILSNGNVGIGTASPGAYKLYVNGNFYTNGDVGGVTKSFIIEHPTKKDLMLKHGSLEGPEYGVYVRGKTKTKIIELPDYWTGLVDENTITVNLTSIGPIQQIGVEKIEDNKVYIAGDLIECFFTIFAERKDINKLLVEYEKQNFAE